MQNILKEIENTPSPHDDLLLSLISKVKNQHFADADIAASLARVYADSGVKLNLPDGLYVDIASTGGPSSLSTLITPLFFASCGLKVPKLGVPGRPAGGIDCLAQIPGYRYILTIDQVLTIIAHCNYAHFLVDKNFVPLDKQIFRLRQQYDAMSVPTLAAASLLSKKLASGLQIAGLDIRVAPHGNFGGSWPVAKDNALLFKKTAQTLKIDAHTILTDARFPYQPYIGRQESLIALWHIFENQACNWLNTHLSQCRIMAIMCSPDKYKNFIAKLTPNDLKAAFTENLIMQGASYFGFSEIVSHAKSEHGVFVSASEDGFISYSLEKLRAVLVSAQKKYANNKVEFPDPIGVKLLKQPNEWVERGEPIISIRTSPSSCNIAGPQ